MVDYIRQLSGPEIFRASYSIYFGNWRVISGIYFLPVLPVIVLYSLFAAQRSVGMALISLLLLFLASVITTAALTIAVADVCLQRPPSVSRSWRLALSCGFGRLLGTQLLAGALAGLAMLLLIVPGIIVGMMFTFSLSVAALENVAGMPALRRSRELARGTKLRNFGVIVLVSIPLYLVIFVVSALGGVVVTISAGGSFANWLFSLVTNVLSQLMVPPLLIGIVLLYYDMRARKEAFDSTALAQELMH